MQANALPVQGVFIAGDAMTTLHGLPPVLDTRTHTLILGSFPSAASLQAQQYYAHPQNQFWRILGALLGQPLADLPYAERWPHLLAAGIGVWDVYARCERQGSLDSDIRAAQENDFAALKTQLPNLQQICFNGKTAARLQRRFAALGYGVQVLPSTSPAYTLSFDQKLERWRMCLGPFPSSTQA